MDICIIGSGYVGLVTGACFADLGNQVICVDSDEEKIRILEEGKLPFYEPGLEELVQRNVAKNRLSFTANLKEGVRKSEIIFIAVGTPSRENGETDLSYVEAVSREIAEELDDYKVIVEKSTVPVETGKWVAKTIKIYNSKRADFDVVSNPEFLREGSAIYDFMHPDRIVIGVENERARAIMEELYKPLCAPLVFTDIKSAEIIKHASNSFLATKISFINAISNICEKVGADVMKVAEGIGLDHRIGKDFLEAGIGYGGSCFPKDVDAFIHIAEKNGYNFELLKAVKAINEKQKELILVKVKQALWNITGKTIGVLGLSFKPNTDDMRSAPSIDIIRALEKEGAKIKAFDPAAMEKAKKLLPQVKFCQDTYEVACGAQALIILTEWNEFKELDLEKIKSLMKVPVIIDGRNIYNPQKISSLGFIYFGIGTGVASNVKVQID